jgi:hypothetical protein
VHEAWLQELKHAVTDAGAAIDGRRAPKVRQAKREARQLPAEQVQARIAREPDAACRTVRSRAGQLLRRALEDGNGQV